MLLYDIQGMFFGVIMASLGVVFLQAAGLITGQTAGLAVLLSYISDFEFGIIFFVISFPFFLLSWRHKEISFTLKTIIAVIGLSIVTPLLNRYVEIDYIPGILAATIGGLSCGVGLVALFRHNSSAGGLGILALIVEKKTGFKAGWFQLCFDIVVFGLALFALDFDRVLYSFFGALLLNATIAWNFHIGQVGN